MSASNSPKVLTVRECAKWLKISLSSCYEGIRSNQIPSIKIGRRVLVPLAALEAKLRGEKVA